MSSPPLITIAVLARNAAATLGDCLASLRALEHVPGELDLLVVDNGSTDATADIARAHGVRVVAESKVGFAPARNAAVRAARGEIITFVDSDCAAEPDWLVRLLARADRPEIGCFVGMVKAKDTRALIPRWFEDRELVHPDRLLSFMPPMIPGANMAYRRSVFEAVGSFDEGMVAGEDGDFFWRVVRSDRFLVRYERQAVVLHDHPRRFWRLLRRAWTEGRGLGAFRHKHRKDLSVLITSLRRALWSYLGVLAGALVVPAKMVRSLRARRPLAESVAYPLLDKAYSVVRSGGTLFELVRQRYFAGGSGHA